MKPTTQQTSPPSLADAIRAGFTKDPRKAQQFHYRKDAVSAAVSIGWTRGDVCEINVMGFKLWAICDPHTSMLTPDGFTAAREAMLLSHDVNFKAGVVMTRATQQTSPPSLADAIRAAMPYVEAYANQHPGSGEDISAAHAALRAALPRAEAADALAEAAASATEGNAAERIEEASPSVFHLMRLALRRYRGDK